MKKPTKKPELVINLTTVRVLKIDQLQQVNGGASAMVCGTNGTNVTRVCGG